MELREDDFYASRHQIQDIARAKRRPHALAANFLAKVFTSQPRAGEFGAVSAAQKVAEHFEQYEYIAKKPYTWYSVCMTSRQYTNFEWDPEKDRSNQNKHGISFMLAQYAFADPNRVILKDVTHSTEYETRYLLSGEGGRGHSNRAFYVS